jgi:BCD family chlorophyll transporter-like MFS transporter
MAARGILAGIAAFTCVIFAAPFGSVTIFYVGALLIGFGGGLFSVALLTAAMTMPVQGNAGRGLALGAWGAAQATGAGLSILIGGAVRDLVNHAAGNGMLGEALATPATGYSAVYQIEIGLLFITLIALGPLVRTVAMASDRPVKLELAEFPT